MDVPVVHLTMDWRIGMTNDEQLSWNELAELTHETQVDKFGFCMCEDLEPHEYPYDDCPKTGEN